MILRTLAFLLLFPIWATSQIITTVAGGGTMLGDGGPASSAAIVNPGGMIFDKNGNIYIASGIDNRVRKIDGTQIITTVAGTGVAGYSGDGGPATSAQLKFPTDVAMDSAGNLYISTTHNFSIRKVDRVTGIISTICGNGIQAFTGDNGPASLAQLYSPSGICFDKSGNLYIAEGSKHCIRKINTSGIITTFAGTTTAGYNGDGIPATSANLFYPMDVEADYLGNIYVADQGNNRIRKIDVATGLISTYAGNGNAAYLGVGISATLSQFTPTAICFDRTRNMYITGNYRVSKIDKDGIFYRVTGDGSMTNSGDAGPAVDASIYDPLGLAVDSCNNLYVSLRQTDLIRKIAFNPDCLPINVKDVKGNEGISVTLHPNPATETLTITAGVEIESVSVMNAIGQCVVRRAGSGERQMPIDIRELPPGVYMVRVNEVWVGKFVKE